MFCIILVTELPVSSIKLIWSPILNSVKNLVPEPTNTSAWSAGFSNPIPKSILVPSVASSKIIVSPLSVPLASDPSIMILPCDSPGSIVETVPFNSITEPKFVPNEAFAV